MSTSKSWFAQLGPKQLFVSQKGEGSGTLVFIHGLGGNHVHFDPLLSSLSESYKTISYDLDGHGLSPINHLANITIESYANDLHLLLQQVGNTKTNIIAHSMGCLVVQVFAIKWPEYVEKIVLLGPPPYPLPEAGADGLRKRADIVRGSGMSAIADVIVAASTSQETKKNNPLALSLVLLSVLTTQTEGYAKACTAFAGDIVPLNHGKVQAPTLVITGSEDQVCPPVVANKLSSTLPNAKAHILEAVGHQHVWEATEQVRTLIKDFLSGH